MEISVCVTLVTPRWWCCLATLCLGVCWVGCTPSGWDTHPLKKPGCAQELSQSISEPTQWTWGWRRCLALTVTEWDRSSVFTRCFSLQQLGVGWRKVSVPMAWVCVDISHAPEQWSMTCRAFAGRGAGVRSQQLSVWGLRWGVRPLRGSYECSPLCSLICWLCLKWNASLNHHPLPKSGCITARHLGFAFSPPAEL